jgi:putative membrane protein
LCSVFVESSSTAARTFARGVDAEGVRTRTRTVEVRTMMGGYGTGMGWGAWLFMGGFWVLLLVLIVWLVVRLLPTGSRPAQSGGESPEEILDRRFARGEIDEHAYAVARAALTATRGPRR